MKDILNSNNNNNNKLNKEDLEFENYKAKLDELFNEKRLNQEKKITQELTLIYDEKIDNELEEELKKIQDDYNDKKNQIEKEYYDKRNEIIQQLEDEFKLKEKEQKENIDINIKKDNKYNSEVELKKKEVINLENEVKHLENELNDLKNDKLKGDDYSKSYNDEIKKIENNYEKQLINYQTYLENELNNKKQEFRNELLNKKLEYENNLKKSESLNNKPENNNNILREKKELLLKNHKLKLEQYKESLINYYQEQVDAEKEKLLIENSLDLNKVKEEHNRLKNLYDCQSLIYTAEQVANINNNMISKIESLFNNKDCLTKNVIEFSYYFLKKKLQEMEYSINLSEVYNKEEILVKLSEIMCYLVYHNIYDYLLNDIEEDKDFIDKSISDISNIIDKIINNFPIHNKIQINMLISNPKFL